ncbi:SMR family transporter [Brevibacterium sp. BRM-1]|uniref:DMT family transporter n=1 Tax=Brevibacterium sp. BRM-1 TaxID=2999062 RepID=UPI002282767B|nr:SMR family transporter [Brevibacterium sp. BRM-1]WAL40462.1 SMR family transporter [Brevibacterium sp. BRM-1]
MGRRERAAAGARGRIGALARSRPAALAVLVLAAACEAVWAHALGGGLRSATAGIAFGCALFASFAGLAWAMRTIPMGTAYAMWTGLGAALTAAWGFADGEPFSFGRVAGIAVIVVAVAGLQLTAGRGAGPRETRAAGGRAAPHGDAAPGDDAAPHSDAALRSDTAPHGAAAPGAEAPDQHGPDTA